jgi:hypothetical protein
MFWPEVREGDDRGGGHPLNRRREREREERDQRERHNAARERGRGVRECKGAACYGKVGLEEERGDRKD